jgi:hypothetical protein
MDRSRDNFVAFFRLLLSERLDLSYDTLEYGSEITGEPTRSDGSLLSCHVLLGPVDGDLDPRDADGRRHRQPGRRRARPAL